MNDIYSNGNGQESQAKPKAPPSRGAGSRRLTERLSQICIEKPKPQIQFAVWKGRNEHRGKETSLAAARSVVVISDAPPTAPSFLSQEKRWGRKECLVTFWCFLPLNLGGHQCFGLSFHSVVTLRASWYAPPDTGGVRFVTSCRRTIAVNRRCSRNFDGCYLLAGGITSLPRFARHLPLTRGGLWGAYSKAPLVKGSWPERPEGLVRRSGCLPL